MGTPDNKLSDLVDAVRSWIPWRSDPANLSRDFWMPDQSCRVCYECDSQFTVFNRRHHCRLCGRVFCAKCTANSIPAPSNEPRSPGIGREDCERVRVCSYCYRQWEQGLSTVDNGAAAEAPSNASHMLSTSPSATSLASTKSSGTCKSSISTAGSAPYSTGPYQHVPSSSGVCPHQSAELDSAAVQEGGIDSQRSMSLNAIVENPLPNNQYSFCSNRSDDEDDDYSLYHSDTETRNFYQTDGYYSAVGIDDIDQVYGPHNIVHPDEDNVDSKDLCSSPLLPENYAAQAVAEPTGVGEEEAAKQSTTCDEHKRSPYELENTNAEAVDFENNGLLWIPPEPEDEDDDREDALLDDDDEECSATGEWGYLRPSNSFGNGEYRSKERSNEEHRNAMKNVVDGHFKALVAQLLQVENLPVGDDNDRESWLEIVTSLSWEAATLLKPDTSKGGGMDPGGYVKVKCIACGRPSESMVVKGVVCKKNIAHRRMTSRIDKPRFLILGGALEYQRVSNLLSSFDTLLQQEMDHLKMAVAKIDAHHPDVLLVEKSVSRHAQEYLLAKNISLVLNIKRPLLERIARCTGAQIVSSIDHLTSPKLGYCDLFHVDKFLEVHGSAGQDGKKLTKTLMFFEGCPKPFGCTVFLKGASGEELKKVKHVVQYGVFAAYHLALETSFLADEGASIPDLPLKSPITVALPDKPSGIDRSISTIPGFDAVLMGKPMRNEIVSETEKSNKQTCTERNLSTNCKPFLKSHSHDIPRNPRNPLLSTDSFIPLPTVGQDAFAGSPKQDFSIEETNNFGLKKPFPAKESKTRELMLDNTEPFGQGNCTNHGDENASDPSHTVTVEEASVKKNNNDLSGDVEPLKEEFPPSPSDHQSILVSLSTRCVWKGTVCERAHLFRIKYYGNFDKPLGRFLRDNLFDQSYLCRSCSMPSEAHVHCYTHRQGSLTISVKKLPEFLLPGEKEGKIWMWHRCLKCRRTNGFPPATRRIVMSDAAWGLSFGKFLELSFSNHAAASRVASCGHSLHRDCLRFYGFGRMVACFRYASIDVLSVHLPPPKFEFYFADQEWIQKEANDVHKQAELLFTEVQNALRQISQKTAIVESNDAGIQALELKQRNLELEEMLLKEKNEIEEALQKALCKKLKAGQPAIDILDINKLRRRLVFLSYVWDQRLIHAASFNKNNLQESIRNSSTPKLKEKSVSAVEKIIETSVAPKPVKGLSLNSCDSFCLETKNDLIQQGNDERIFQPGGAKNDENEVRLPSSGENRVNKCDPQENDELVRRVRSEGEYPIVADLSDTLDAAWTGEYPSITPKEDGCLSADPSLVKTVTANAKLENPNPDPGKIEVLRSVASAIPLKGLENLENSTSLVSIPFLNFNNSFKNLSFGAQKLLNGENNPIYVSLFRESERKSGARLLLPVGINDTVVPVYDDEPTSFIAYTLVSSKYHLQMSDSEKPKDAGDSSVSLPISDPLILLSLNSFDESTVADTSRSFGSGDESMLVSTSGSRGSQGADPVLFSKDLHARISFTDDGPLGKVQYIVTCYYAKSFEALRRMCCPELDFIRSLSRCKKWDAQGGKSNVFFAKTLDDRFIIKQVTKTELESFIKFGPAYFKYLTESISTGSPTCLAKIVGIYQVSSKHAKGGKETKMDIMVMENLLFRRNVTRLYDLKGSARSRYNPDTTGSNKVLLDQNLIEAMSTSPIFVGNKAKRSLERAVWNDTSFLASIDVMDYSLLVGVDEEKHELVVGIIDYMRQYTWDKHLETWVKTSGILGGPKNAAPTVISPQQYKKRFRKAMTTYFLMVPDQWFPATIIPSLSQSDLCEENVQSSSCDS